MDGSASKVEYLEALEKQRVNKIKNESKLKSILR